jgi:hypothetical protein
VSQPGRPPVVAQPRPKHGCREWEFLFWLVVLLALILGFRRKKK